MEKINIAELLEGCPSGLELDCTVYDECKLDSILEGQPYPVKVRTPEGAMLLTKYGSLSCNEHAKCVIFPKGKTTWEGFQRPFKDGDIVYIRTSNQWICIYKEGGEKEGVCYKYAAMASSTFVHDSSPLCHQHHIKFMRFATDEEKAKLFSAIKENGYHWNFQAKRLEELITPKFKKGDKVRVKNGVSEPRIIDGVCDTFYSLVPIGKIDFTDQDNWELVPVIEPKFKVGDKVRLKNNKTIIKTISCIYYGSYRLCDNHLLFFEEQDEYELVPNKFDITTLKPFDKVLVRWSTLEKWRIQLFEKYDETYQSPFICLGSTKYNQCVPYESNKHLLNTTDDCNDFYKIWE